MRPYRSTRTLSGSARRRCPDAARRAAGPHRGRRRRAGRPWQGARPAAAAVSTSGSAAGLACLVDEQLAHGPREALVLAEVGHPHVARRPGREAHLHAAPADTAHRVARRPVERPVVGRHLSRDGELGAVDGRLEPESERHLLVAARQPRHHADRMDVAEVDLEPGARRPARGPPPRAGVPVDCVSRQLGPERGGRGPPGRWNLAELRRARAGSQSRAARAAFPRARSGSPWPRGSPRIRSGSCSGARYADPRRRVHLGGADRVVGQVEMRRP